MRTLLKNSYLMQRPLESGLFVLLSGLGASLTLRLANCFYTWSAAAAPLGTVILLLCIRAKHDTAERHNARLLLLAGIAFVTVIGLQPNETLTGNWDPGVYLAQGAAASRTTGWTLPDSAAEVIPPEARNAVYPRDRGIDVKVPGFYVSRTHPDSLAPQFFPLYPTLLALAARAGGLTLALRTDLICFLIGYLFLADFARRITGSRTAGLLVIVLALAHPAVHWFARFHTSESLLFLLFSVFIWSTSRCMCSHHTSHALLAAGAALLVPWATPAALPWVIFLPAICLMRPLRIAHRITIVASGLCGTSGILFFLQHTDHPYAGSIQRMVPDPSKWLKAIAGKSGVGELMVFFTALAVLAALYRLLRNRSVDRRLGMIIGISLVFILNAVSYWAAPLCPPFLKGALTLVPLPLAGATAIGMIYSLYRRPELRAWICWLGIVTITATCIFLIWPMIPAQFPWAWKRWIWMLLPVAITFSAVALQSIRNVYPGRFGALLLCLAVAGITALPLHYHFGLLRAGEWRGLRSWMDNLSQAIPEHAIVIAPKALATPLEFIYGHTVIPLYDNPITPREQAYLDIWNHQSPERPVYVIAENPPSWLPDSAAVSATPAAYHGYWIRQKRSASYFGRQARAFSPIIWFDPKEYIEE